MEYINCQECGYRHWLTFQESESRMYGAHFYVECDNCGDVLYEDADFV